MSGLSELLAKHRPGGDPGLGVVYERFLSPLRGMARTVLVVSNSARYVQVWLDFLPESEVFWLGCLKSGESVLSLSNRVHGFLSDGPPMEGDLTKFLDLVGNRFPVILDDGSVLPGDRIQVCRIFFPRLSRGGFFCSELLPEGTVGNQQSAGVKLRDLVGQVSEVPPAENADPFCRVLYDRLMEAYFLQTMVALKSGLKTSEFDEAYYLKNNPDVAEAVADQRKNWFIKSGLDHFSKCGVSENRLWRVKNGGVKVYTE